MYIKANANLPISIELQKYVRCKCTWTKNALLLSHISTNAINVTLLINAADNVKRSVGLDADMLLSNNYLNNKNSNAGKNAGSLFIYLILQNRR